MLLERLAPDDGRAETSALRAAVASAKWPDVDLTILVSPHAPATGVYATINGSLNGFGIRGIEADLPTDPTLGEELRAAWGTSMIEEPADHGIVVPLLLRPFPTPVVACGFAEVTGPDGCHPSEVLTAARGLADAVTALSSRCRVLLVASAHSSAALSARAPLTKRTEGTELHGLLVEALGEGSLDRLTQLPADAWHAAGACGAGPLMTLAHLLPHAAVRGFHVCAPFGVGYLSAFFDLGTAS